MGKDLKGKELGKGISQRKDGRYQARFTDRFGKRRCVYGLTLKEVKNALMSEVVDDYSKNNIAEPNMTLDQWYEKWMRVYKKPILKPTTLHHYKQTYESIIKPALGSMPINSITKLVIVDFFNDLMQKHTTYTINNYRSMLHDMFECAIENDMCQKNPVRSIKINGLESKKIVTLSIADQRDFFKAAQKSFHYNAYVVAINTGLRSGELRALNLDDIDLENDIIYVHKTLNYYNKDGAHIFTLSTPKTKSSIRKVPINSICKAALKNQIEVLSTLPRPNYDTDVFGTLIFVTRTNTPMSNEIWRRSMRTVVNRANKARLKNNQELIPFFSSHTFRHTFATRCFEAGVPAKTVQTYLGHSCLQTTMDTYTVVLEDQKFRDMELLEKAMKKIG